jgi:hypothetical protein
MRCAVSELGESKSAFALFLHFEQVPARRGAEIHGFAALLCFCAAVRSLRKYTSLGSDIIFSHVDSIRLRLRPDESAFMV